MRTSALSVFAVRVYEHIIFCSKSVQITEKRGSESTLSNASVFVLNIRKHHDIVSYDVCYSEMFAGKQ